MLTEKRLVQGPQHRLEAALSISFLRKTLRGALPGSLLETGQLGVLTPGHTQAHRSRAGHRAEGLIDQDLVREGGGSGRGVHIQIPIRVDNLFIGDKRLVCLVKCHKLLEDFLFLLKVSLNGLKDWFGVCGLLDHMTFLLVFLDQSLDGGGVGCCTCGNWR